MPLLLTLLTIFGSTTIAQAQELPLPLVVITFAPIAPLPEVEPTIEEKVRATQEKYQLGNDFYETLKCESSGWKNIQSMYRAKGPNGREDSWGVAQIHLPAHKDISREQALDPDFAIDWAAEQFTLGKANMWTCWRNLPRK